jgi:hypothetical protein
VTAARIAPATVPRSQEARSGRDAGLVRCAWPPCPVRFVPRATGGQRQKYHAPACRELAKAAGRLVCPHCGGSLRRRDRGTT